MTKIAVYAGSFDPITKGHLDIIKTGLRIFDKMIVGVAFNPEKKEFLPVDIRIELIKQSIKGLENIEVCSFDGLTVDFAKEHGAEFLLRGLRSSMDFEYENQLALINLFLSKDIQTIFVPSKSEHSFISSSAVRELISYKKDLSQYVPDAVANFLYKKFNY